jgi:chromosome segregation ATPase
MNMYQEEIEKIQSSGMDFYASVCGYTRSRRNEFWKELEELEKEVSGIAVNLSQVARRLNNLRTMIEEDRRLAEIVADDDFYDIRRERLTVLNDIENCSSKILVPKRRTRTLKGVE